MLNINLIRVIINILAENGETRALTLVKLINKYTSQITVREPMVFEHRTDKDNQLEITFTSVVVDWGDGQIDKCTEHKYEFTKKYRVKIYNESTNHLIILVISNWANNITDFISIGRINIFDLSCLFACTKFNGKIKPNWDTSQIINMSGMFSKAINFNQKIPDNWDTRNVINMSCMFYGAEKFNQKIGDNWDTSRVIDMSRMFANTYVFNQKIGDNWDISKVTNLCYMFAHALAFNQKIGDNWDTSSVITMYRMFYNALSFNQKIGDNWNILNDTNMTGMFYNAVNFNQKINVNWDYRDIISPYYIFYEKDNLD